MKKLWNEIKYILKNSTRKVKIINNKVYDDTLNNLNIDKNSMLGQVITNTSGIFIDNYIRLFGNGSKDVSYNIYEYNLEFKKYFDDNMIIVADDVFGGLFSVTN